MKLRMSTSVSAGFPEASIGVVTLDDVDNGGETDPSLRAAISARSEELQGQVSSVDEVPTLAVWQRAYRKFGTNPRKHRPSAEALVRRALNGKLGRSISPLVDCYIYVSLQTLLPIGGYDMDALVGDVVLRTSTGGERFVALGGAHEVTEKGEVVYADQNKILTRRWNHRDGEIAKIHPSSTSVVLLCESPGEIDEATVMSASDMLADEATRWTGGTASVALLRPGLSVDLRARGQAAFGQGPSELKQRRRG